jgi:phosphomannomutase
MKESIFKAYDIRGEVPTELDETVVAQIGSAFALYLLSQGDQKKFVIGVGRDDRVSSPALWSSFTTAVRKAGITVVDLGLVSSPLFYYAIVHLRLDAGVTVTASHNPAQFNGLKFANEKGLPLEPEEVEKIKTYALDKVAPPARRLGELSLESGVLDAYIDEHLRLVPPSPRMKDVSVVIDTGNGVAAPMCEALFARIPARMTPLFFALDGTFPNHSPNPLEEKNVMSLEEQVRQHKAHAGIAFDADGDRVVFVDEKGAMIPPDLMTALLAKEFLTSNPGEKIAYDVRSSWVVKETIEQCGGIPIISRVGHTNIKQLLQEEEAFFAGELSGHYFFRDIGYFEAPLLAVLTLLNKIADSGVPLSHHIQALEKYCKTDELNFTVSDKEKIIAEVQTHFADAPHVFHLDGLSVEYPDWWFNIRPSNTENLLRLNLEATSPELMNEKLKELTRCIQQTQ